MSDHDKRSQHLRFLFAAGVSAIALAVCDGRAAGQTSEIDSYDAAVTSQSKTEALSFIKSFGSSHLVGDLIESLPPEVAQQVCADLQGGGPAKARKACGGLREALAVQPVVPAAGAPAAGSAAVDPVSTGADTSAGVSSEDEPAGGSAAVDPVSTGADTSTVVSSDNEPAGELDAGDADTARDTNLFYLPVIATAPAAGTPVAEPVSGAVTSKGGQGNGGTDEPDGQSIILQTARTVPTATAAVPSVSTSTSASKAAPDVDEPDTSQAQSNSSQGSNTQSGSAESSSGQGSSGQSSSGQSNSGQGSNTQSGSTESSSGQGSNSQSGNAQSSGDQSGSGKGKGGKDKGGKDKGGKGKGGADKGSG